jgi:hypothetical protein
MSGYTFESTAVTSAADCKALPRTGREDPVGVAGNTVFFSKGPEQDIEETEGPAFLVRCDRSFPFTQMSLDTDRVTQASLPRWRRVHRSRALASK